MASIQDKADPKSEDKTEKEDVSFAIKLNDFIQKNRGKFFAGLIAALVIFAGVIAGSAIREKLRADAFSAVDEFGRRYDALRIHIGSEDPEAASKQPDIDALLADLDAFARRRSGFAAARAYTLSAGIYDAQKKWAEAELLWLAAAKAADGSYLEPISVFNAAVAAEEQGNTETAIGLYAQAMAHADIFPGAARAQFSVGRLEESRNNKAAALAAYQNLVSQWPAAPVWANLAQSRIVALSD